MNSGQRAYPTPEVVDQILSIGQRRYPREACGVVMPPNLVCELQNKARNPRKGYEIDTEELVQVLADNMGSVSLERKDILLWHTHPSGTVGPSKGDMESRIDGFRYLVVAMPSGEATIF